jgi:hypothetical protein
MRSSRSRPSLASDNPKPNFADIFTSRRDDAAIKPCPPYFSAYARKRGSTTPVRHLPWIPAFAQGCPGKQIGLRRRSAGLAFVVTMACQTRFHRHGRACPGHPRLSGARHFPWMPGTSPGMTIKDGIAHRRDSPSLHHNFPRTALRESGNPGQVTYRSPCWVDGARFRGVTRKWLDLKKSRSRAPDRRRLGATKSIRPFCRHRPAELHLG